MSRRPLLALLFLALALAVPATAELQVERIAVATSVADREPVGAADSFPADVGEVVCFTRLIGVEAEATIAHVWYHDGVEKRRIELGVKPPAWRTWSVKRIPASATGEWRVAVVAGDGHELASVTFTIR